MAASFFGDMRMGVGEAHNFQGPPEEEKVPGRTSQHPAQSSGHLRSWKWGRSQKTCSAVVVEFGFSMKIMKREREREGRPEQTKRHSCGQVGRRNYFFGRRKKGPLFDWKFPPSPSAEMEAGNSPGAHIENVGEKRRRTGAAAAAGRATDV